MSTVIRLYPRIADQIIREAGLALERAGSTKRICAATKKKPRTVQEWRAGSVKNPFARAALDLYSLVGEGCDTTPIIQYLDSVGRRAMSAKRNDALLRDHRDARAQAMGAAAEFLREMAEAAESGDAAREAELADNLMRLAANHYSHVREIAERKLDPREAMTTPKRKAS